MKIQTVTEYITVIEKLKNAYTYEVSAGVPTLPEHKYVYSPKFIYRGHGNHEKYQLIPGAFRWKKLSDGHEVGEYSQLEYNILSDFISESCRYIKDIPINDIAAWLEIAQHFGAPTRLLDFTENPLVALYFACNSSVDKDASVWIINEAYYNQLYFGTPLLFALHAKQLIGDIIDCEIMYQQRPPADHIQYSQYPIIYRPAYREERMSTQSSVFMLWAALRMPLTNIIPQENYMKFDEKPEKPQNGVIAPIIIPSDAKRQILSQLDKLGINEKFIYPGLDGVGKYIKSRYSYKQETKL